ncbi:hypothetical protein EON65_23220 [archaeon]|nr:MAG: hypothetical protein EON65_23220 [archaeon]
MMRLPSARIHVKAAEESTPREKAVAYSQMTIWKLTFKDEEDEVKYLRSLRNLFFFPSFWPIIIVFIAFTLTQSGVVRQLSNGDGFLATSFAINMTNFIIIFFYTVAQFSDYLHTYVPRRMHEWAKTVLVNRLEDVIIILSSTAQGVYQLSLVSRDLCSGCTTIFEVEKCSETTERAFPVNQTFFAYVSLIMLPIYFKSVSRHVILFSWLIVTAFVVATHVYGQYRLDGSVVLFVIFFLVSILEFERYKMISFLLSKEALTYEQNRLFLMQEKSKIIERKLHLALVHQILPPKVAEQIIQGKQVVPEHFEEVTIFFSGKILLCFLANLPPSPAVV